MRPPSVVRAFGRAVGLPVVAVRSYWVQEAASIRAGSVALAIGLVATVIAGVVLGSAGSRLDATPGLLALIPAAIGMRGSIFGAFGSRLATAIHTGEFRPALTRDSFLGNQVEAAALLSAASAALAGALAWLVSVLLGLPTVSILHLMAISFAAAVLSSIVLFFVTISLARRSQQHGWNMDDVGAPLITATGDLITLPALLIASLVTDVGGVADVLGAVAIVGLVAGLWIGIRSHTPAVRRVVRESVLVLALAVAIDVAAGAIIESRVQEQFTHAALLLLLPAFIANCGSLGGMLASRLASQLHVGQLVPRLLPGRAAALDFSLTALLATLAFSAVGFAGWFASVLVPAVTPLPLGTMMAVSLGAAVLATPLLALTAYGAATASFRFGFDPDNHGIPIVTATMDLGGVVCLVAAITVLVP
ncbi:MAG: magnesium transporter [Nitriliruptoraceae bacterium]